MKKVICLLCAAALAFTLLLSRRVMLAAGEAFSPAGSGLTLVIDAGHGGEDGGATAENIRESVLNLSVARKTELLSDFLGFTTLMTRESETISYPPEADTVKKRKMADMRRRVKLVSSVRSPVFISIHQNKFSLPSAYGFEAYFGACEGSAELADTIQSLVNALLEKDNRRTSARISDEIYIMKNVGCPAVLVECGFISNPRERERLTDGGYQRKLSAIIVGSVLQCLGSLEEHYGKG